MKEKKKAKMKTVDTMPIKRTQFGADANMQEADASQDQEEKAGPSKKKKGPQRRINIDVSRWGGLQRLTISQRTAPSKAHPSHGLNCFICHQNSGGNGQKW